MECWDGYVYFQVEPRAGCCLYQASVKETSYAVWPIADASTIDNYSQDGYTGDVVFNLL